MREGRRRGGTDEPGRPRVARCFSSLSLPASEPPLHAVAHKCHEAAKEPAWNGATTPATGWRASRQRGSPSHDMPPHGLGLARLRQMRRCPRPNLAREVCRQRPALWGWYHPVCGFDFGPPQEALIGGSHSSGWAWMLLSRAGSESLTVVVARPRLSSLTRGTAASRGRKKTRRVNICRLL